MSLSIRAFILPLLMTAGALSAADGTATPAAVKPYPLKTCIVSGQPLDAMGGPEVLVKDGQEVKFCCPKCIKTFNQDPAKYLAQLNQASAPATKPAAEPATAPAEACTMGGCCGMGGAKP